jgi:hypothetical protein
MRVLLTPLPLLRLMQYGRCVRIGAGVHAGLPHLSVVKNGWAGARTYRTFSQPRACA